MVAARNDCWSLPDPPPPVAFRIEECGDANPAIRPLGASLRGIAKHVVEDRLDVGIPGFRTAAGSLHYHLPASIDLRPLVGRKLGIHIVGSGRFPARRGQTLFVESVDGRSWLVAHHGANPLWHNVGGEDLSATFSPEPGGPLVVGPPGRECQVRAGESAELVCGRRRYVVEFVSRDASGAGAYVIADACLWH